MFHSTVIIGNNLRVDDSISPPAYLDLLDVFPRLTALQHRAWAPSVSAKLLAEPFDFTPLEALDLFVPDTLCDLAGPPPPSWPRSQVKSLTLREYRWWMLYTEVSFASPDPNESAMYFDYLCKHFKGIKQLNLSPQLIADVDPFICTLEKVGERTRSWMTRENLPEVERVNIRFDAAYKVRQEDICALVSFGTGNRFSSDNSRSNAQPLSYSASNRIHVDRPFPDAATHPNRRRPASPRRHPTIPRYPTSRPIPTRNHRILGHHHAALHPFSSADQGIRENAREVHDGARDGSIRHLQP